jgi:hypothetical protein
MMWFLAAMIGVIQMVEPGVGVFTDIADGYYCANSRVSVGDDVPSSANGPFVTTLSIAKIVENRVDVGWIYYMSNRQIFAQANPYVQGTAAHAFSRREIRGRFRFPSALGSKGPRSKIRSLQYKRSY